MDYEYFSKHKFIAIDLIKQTELENYDLKQQINFIAKLERNEGATMFFIIEKSEKALFIFHKILQASYKMKTQKIINLLMGSSNEESKFATKNGMS